MNLTTGKNNNILDFFYSQMEEEEWLEGVDLNQTGYVTLKDQYNQMTIVHVESSGPQPHEVRIKLHSNGQILQWIECSCYKSRRSHTYCQHMAASILFLYEKKNSALKNLKVQAPAKPTPTKLKKALYHSDKSAPVLPKSSASQSLLHHIKQSVEQISFDSHKGEVIFSTKSKGEASTSYSMGVDAAANFIQKQSTQAGQPSTYNDLQYFTKPLSRGLYISFSAQDELSVEKALICHDPDNFKHFKKLASHRAQIIQTAGEEVSPNPTQEALVVPISSIATQVGKQHLFVPKVGFFPLDAESPAQWHSLANQETLSGDEAAQLVDSKFKKYNSHGTLWACHTVASSLSVESPELTQMELTNVENGWFFLSPQYTLKSSNSDPLEVSMAELIKHAHKSNKKYYKTKRGWLKIPEFLNNNSWQLSADEEELKLSQLDLIRFQAYSGKMDGLAGSTEMLKKLRQATECGENTPLPEKAESNLNLRNYQKDGFRWLWWLYKSGLHGLLADDMGLGKTHQAMSLLGAIASQETGPVRFLVTCPTTVLEHWKEKISYFAPHLNPHLHYGPNRAADLNRVFQERVTTIITSYGVLNRDSYILKQHNWNVVILDEAHFIKNNKTITYQAACSLRSNMRLCLTGTPLENHLGELKNIFDFLVPGYLGSDNFFRKNFLQPILENKNEEREQVLQKLIHPLKIRRTKDQVLGDLPSKVEDYRYAYLSEEQSRLYQKVLQMKGKPLIERLTDEKGSIPYLHILATLQLLKQVVNHPALVQPQSDFRTLQSGKFEVLKEVIEESILAGKKIVIFSQYLGMVKIIKEYCEDKKIQAVTLTGSTQNRGKVIQSFQTDPNIKIFIGSLLAGGMGIDLTAASVVIHYDRWWNASKENQATDRVHRIGQKNFVQVFKLVTKGTLEEKIDRLISKKSDLFSRFLEKDEEIFKSLGRKEMIDLLQ